MTETTTRTAAMQRYAVGYIRKGRSPIPVPAKSKNPNRPEWQNLIISEDEVEKFWTNGQNIGLLLGQPSGGLVDVDLDSPAARAVASHLLPKTLVSGRDGCPHSHRWYVCDPTPESVAFKLPGAGPDRCVVELRSTGLHTLVEPSEHPDGGRYRWEGGEIATLDGLKLREHVEDVAIAALLLGNYPGEGVRHDAVNAAVGFLGRRLPRHRVERVVKAVVLASEDEEPKDRTTTAEVTLDKIALGEKTTGGPTLEEFMPGVVAQLKRWGLAGDKARAEPPLTEKGVGLTKLLADAILDAGEHFARDAGGKLYRYSEGVYKQFGERFIKRRVKELMEAWGETQRWSSHRGNEVVEWIRVDAPELWERPPLAEVNVLNGLLNVYTHHLRPHSPEFLSTVQLPVAYDPEARCPEWEKFVADTFPEDAQELAFELAADIMTPERSEQKSILLIGEGSNGKSTFLTGLSAFAGSTNIAGLSLQKMESDRFAASRLLGKLANICPDLPSSHLVGTSMFKAVTGGDSINAEYKYRESFEFRPFARLVFSANQVPRSEDATHAFFRRWLVVPFDRSFEGDEAIPRHELDAKLSAPGELSGVLNKALEALPRIREKGFTESESMREAWEEFRAMTDPVSVWLDKATVEHADATVAKTELHAAYLRYCDQQGRAGMTSRAFGRALKRVRPAIGETQITLNDKRVWAWFGIGLKSDTPPPEGDDAPNARNARNSTNCFLKW